MKKPFQANMKLKEKETKYQIEFKRHDKWGDLYTINFFNTMPRQLWYKFLKHPI